MSLNHNIVLALCIGLVSFCYLTLCLYKDLRKQEKEHNELRNKYFENLAELFRFRAKYGKL